MLAIKIAKGREFYFLTYINVYKKRLKHFWAINCVIVQRKGWKLLSFRSYNAVEYVIYSTAYLYYNILFLPVYRHNPNNGTVNHKM